MSATKLDPYTAQAEANEHTPQEKITGLHEIIKGAKVGMLTTRSADGSLHSRAMTPSSPYTPTQLNLVFLANNASHKFDEIEHDAHVNVSFFNNDTTAWASFSGKARVTKDKDIIKKHWSSYISAYFGDLKDGVHKGDETDPRVCVIEVVPDEIRYWMPNKIAITRAIEAGIGAMTGRLSVPGEIRTINAAEATQLTEESDELEAQPYPFEILITHVSFYFRAVAIETPLLWSYVDTRSAISSEKIETYLGRGKGCSLDVRLDIKAPDATIMKKIDAVLPHSHRYQTLVIDSTSETPIIQRFENVVAPILQHLSVSVEEVEDHSADKFKILQGGAPRLTSVRLRGLALLFFRPPLKNVTTLHLDQVSSLPVLYATFVEIVSAPCFLQNLSVYGDIVSTEQSGANWPGLNSPINLPHLRSLRLNSLVLKDVGERDLERFWASPLHQLKFPALRQLTLIDSELSKDACAEILRGFPCITSFAISYALTPSILPILSDVPSGEVPWPMLNTLTMRADFDDDNVAADIVAQRMAVGCPLMKLKLGSALPLFMLPNYLWLRKNVELERFVEFDTWPGLNNLQFDQDDTLFL
ncbi:hypothetical protein DXG01_005015 [Tephrocybe rancida]|nr:hypothetical protein DXG01_005015 [Tephrocybe rancida]